MSTNLAERPNTALATEEKKVSFTPFGEQTPIEITIGQVINMICTPTKSGKLPTQADAVKFLMICKARALNPWVGDAYLTGYDTKDGAQFSIITAVQAMFKRAENSPLFNGIESGVLLQAPDGGFIERQGDFVGAGEKLLGSWARCHKKNLAVPIYDSIKLSTFNTGRSRWEKDPAGMIVKCAEASVLRKAFPSQISGMYTREEMTLFMETSPNQPPPLRGIARRAEPLRLGSELLAQAGPEDNPADEQEPTKEEYEQWEKEQPESASNPKPTANATIIAGMKSAISKAKKPADVAKVFEDAKMYAMTDEQLMDLDAFAGARIDKLNEGKQQQTEIG